MKSYNTCTAAHLESSLKVWTPLAEIPLIFPANCWYLSTSTEFISKHHCCTINTPKKGILPRCCPCYILICCGHDSIIHHSGEMSVSNILYSDAIHAVDVCTPLNSAHVDVSFELCAMRSSHDLGALSRASPLRRIIKWKWNVTIDEGVNDPGNKYISLTSIYWQSSTDACSMLKSTTVIICSSLCLTNQLSSRMFEDVITAVFSRGVGESVSQGDVSATLGGLY